MITLSFLSMQDWTAANWALIAFILFLCLLVLALYTWGLYQRIPKHHTPLIGRDATVVTWQGRDRRVEVFGAIWQAELPHDVQADVKPGDIVRVHAVHNLVLTVTPVGEI